MRPKRKLLTTKGFALLREEMDRGVPVRRAIENLGISCSIPTAKQLYTLASIESENLTPPWLNQEGSLLQECPPEWRFKGFFPLAGEWICSKQ
jgi:hypothetical protein